MPCPSSLPRARAPRVDRCPALPAARVQPMSHLVDRSCLRPSDETLDSCVAVCQESQPASGPSTRRRVGVAAVIRLSGLTVHSCQMYGRFCSAPAFDCGRLDVAKGVPQHWQRRSGDRDSGKSSPTPAVLSKRCPRKRHWPDPIQNPANAFCFCLPVVTRSAGCSRNRPRFPCR